MVPAGLTIAALFLGATSVVTEFSGLILLVCGLALGIWGVRFVIGLVRRAKG